MDNYYLIETSGGNRQVWGPYSTLEKAQKEAGTRHAVVTGRGLSNGMVMTRGALQAALLSGRISITDGSDKYALVGG